MGVTLQVFENYAFGCMIRPTPASTLVPYTRRVRASDAFASNAFASNAFASYDVPRSEFASNAHACDAVASNDIKSNAFEI